MFYFFNFFIFNNKITLNLKSIFYLIFHILLYMLIKIHQNLLQKFWLNLKKNLQLILQD